MIYVYLAMAALIGGLVQGMTGFGAGIFSMLVLPYLLPLPEAAGVSGAIAIWICGMLAYRYRRAINWRNIWVTVAIYITASLTAIQMASHLNTTNLKLAFGVFLIILSLYFLRIKDRLTITPTLAMQLLVGLLSGLSDGFFGIGGPLMVVLYMAQSSSREEYLGTLQMSFVLVSLVNLTLRLQQGILEARHLPYVLIGIFGMTLGLQIANRLADKLNPDVLRQSTYVLIGLSGILTLVTTLW